MNPCKGHRGPGVLLLVVLAVPELQAQQSASYKLDEHVVNLGGNPSAGAVPSSTDHLLAIDAVGTTATVTSATSASYRMDAGFLDAYPPPGEVTGLAFTDKTTLVWDAERSVGAYDVYRGLLSSLPAGYGDCLGAAVPVETTADADVPPPGDCYFYLVTAVNRLAEEGTKGFDSSGAERPNPVPCN